MGSDLDGMSETFGIQKLGVPIQVKGCKLIRTNRSEQICLWMKFPIYFATTLPSSPSNPITGKLILHCVLTMEDIYYDQLCAPSLNKDVIMCDVQNMVEMKDVLV
jgi:hypothetical protein